MYIVVEFIKYKIHAKEFNKFPFLYNYFNSKYPTFVSSYFLGILVLNALKIGKAKIGKKILVGKKKKLGKIVGRYKILVTEPKFGHFLPTFLLLLRYLTKIF